MRAAARQFLLDSEFNRGFAQERWNASRASRLVDRRMVLGEVEKEKFRSMMRKVEGCYGVRILTYAILSNHFHILVQVPLRKELSD